MAKNSRPSTAFATAPLNETRQPSASSCGVIPFERRTRKSMGCKGEAADNNPMQASHAASPAEIIASRCIRHRAFFGASADCGSSSRRQCVVMHEANRTTVMLSLRTHGLEHTKHLQMRMLIKSTRDIVTRLSRAQTEPHRCGVTAALPKFCKAAARVA